MQKIIVIGFQHCGTSILKCKLGGCKDAIDFPTEILTLPSSFNNNKIVVIKWPWIPDSIKSAKFNLENTVEYKDYKVVFIIRDPKYCLSSLKKRGKNIISDNSCNIRLYHETAEWFLKLQKQPMPNVFTVKYEELFCEEKWKLLLLQLSLFDNNNNNNNNDSKFNQIVKTIKKSPAKEPDRKDHDSFRTWQINQPFNNMNDDSNIVLTEKEIDLINSNPVVSLLSYQ